MEEQALRALLKRADGEGAGVDAGDLVGGVLRRQARRVRVRRMAVVAPVLVGMAVGVWKVAHPVKQEQGGMPVAAVRPGVLDRAETDRLGREAAAWLAAAKRIEAQERLNRAQAAAAQLEIMIQAQREQAAMVMVRQGDWRRQQGGSGTEEYRRAVELFDGTHAAAIARARLGQG